MIPSARAPIAKNGFKFTVENIKNSSAVKVLNEVIPKDAAQLNSFIKKLLDQ